MTDFVILNGLTIFLFVPISDMAEKEHAEITPSWSSQIRLKG